MGERLVQGRCVTAEQSGLNLRALDLVSWLLYHYTAPTSSQCIRRRPFKAQAGVIRVGAGGNRGIDHPFVNLGIIPHFQAELRE